MYKEVLEKHKVEQAPEFTLDVLNYEVGKLYQIKIYRERFGSTGFIGDERVELGDTLTMISLLIEQKGYNLEEVKREGLGRFDHRIEEVKVSETERKYGDGLN